MPPSVLRTCFLSFSLPWGYRARSGERTDDFPRDFHPFPAPTTGATGQRRYLAPQTTPLAPSCRQLRPSAFGAFNLRMHHRVGQEQVQAGNERERDEKRGWKRDRAERRKKRESEQGSREEREDGAVGRSEKIDKATEERRWRKNGRDLSPHAASRERDRMQF